MRMESASQWEKLLGEWAGANQLWLAPGEAAHESATMASVSSVAQGQFITIAYTWAFEDEPHDGLIIFRPDPDNGPANSVWLDSWHVKNDIMFCDGTLNDRGVLLLEGSYAAPPGPDWGWRIEIERDASDSLVIRMINISPVGQEALAVLAQYRRLTEAPSAP
jgi:hypothetical protein